MSAWLAAGQDHPRVLAGVGRAGGAAASPVTGALCRPAGQVVRTHCSPAICGSDASASVVDRPARLSALTAPPRASR
jgi:hypothetical protein